jgi:hypothetical protein
VDRALVSASHVLPLLVLRDVTRGSVPRGQMASAAPLRAGRYRVWLSPALSPGASVGFVVGRSAQLWTRAAGSLPVGTDGRRWLDVELPIDVSALTVTTDDPSADATATIAPITLAPDDARAAAGRAANAQRYGDATVYFVTDRQFAEPTGLWVRPDGDSEIVIQPDRPTSAVGLLTRNGPIDNQLDLARDDEWDRHELRPGEERRLDVPMPAGRKAVGLRLRVARWWRPSEVDPSSDDVRRLGVWVEIGTPP